MFRNTFSQPVQWVHLFVFDGMSDWEAGHAKEHIALILAGMHSTPQFIARSPNGREELIDKLRE